MCPLAFFTEQFIVANRRERWTFLFSKPEVDEADIQRLPHHLNERCHYQARNARDAFAMAMKGHEQKMVFVTNLRRIQQTMPVGDVTIDWFTDTLVVVPGVNKAFFFDHDTGIWLCE